MNDADRAEALRLARVFDARTEDSHDIIDAATLLSRLAAAPPPPAAPAVAVEPQPCGCRLGECESKPDRLCRMVQEIRRGVDNDGMPSMGGRESVEDALMVVESFGPGIDGLNDTYARQIILADEVKRLRALLAAPAQPAPQRQEDAK
jgi:hypothetical protein